MLSSVSTFGRDSCPVLDLSRTYKVVIMSRVEELQTAIAALAPEEYARLRQWFVERDWEQWDRQIEEDAQAGKLDFLIEEAMTEKAQGRLREL